MLFTFPFQGYAFLSIVFSTLFLLVSYVFAWFFVKYVPFHYKNSWSYRFFKAALVFMIVSSVGPWTLGVIMTQFGSDSVWYKIAIYFYLHFQYNGWFFMALIGVLLWTLEGKGIKLPNRILKRIYILLNLAIITTFLLSILWIKDMPKWIYAIGGMGAILQLIAYLKLFFTLRVYIKDLCAKVGKAAKLAFLMGVLFLFIKLVMQIVSAWPDWALKLVYVQDIVIGYLHLTFLGVISLILLFYFEKLGFTKLSMGVLALYVTAIIFTESLIFYKGIAVWFLWPIFDNYLFLLAFSSALFPLAICCMLYKQWKLKL